MQVIVDQLLTDYEITGHGPIVLLLHGWGDNRHTFDQIVGKLAPNYRTVALDLPGFGASQAPAEAWNLDNYAVFVRDFLAKTELNELFGLIGHSNGGALAIRAVGRGILQPKRLVLLAASGVRTGKQARRLALKVAAKTGKIATLPLSESHRRQLRQKLYGVAGSDMLVAPELAATFKRTVRQDVQADAKDIHQPTLLINGSHDRAVELAIGRRFQQLIAGSQLKVLPTGHFVHQEKVTEVSSLIKEFLAA